MNKKYKQWKKLGADPRLLSVIAVFMFIVIYLIWCIISKFVGWFFTYTVAVLHNYALPKLAINPVDFFIPQVHGKIVFLLVVITWLVIVPRMLYNMRKGYKDLNLGSDGTAEFTSVREAIEQYPKVKLDEFEYPGESGVPVLHLKSDSQENGYFGDKSQSATKLSKFKKVKKTNEDGINGYNLIDTNNTNSIVDAGSQSGKTQMFTYPSIDHIMRAEKKDSILLTDIKGNMVKMTRKELQRFGYKVLILNLVNTNKSLHYNPLEMVKNAYFEGDISEAEQLARTFAFTLYHQEKSSAEPMWEQNSIALFVSMVMFMCKVSQKQNKPDIVNIYNLVGFADKYLTQAFDDGSNYFDLKVQEMERSDPARVNYLAIRMSQGITRSGIFSGFVSGLSEFVTKNIGELTSHSDFDFKELAYGKQPVALFIVAPDYDDSKYKIVSSFIGQCSYVLSKAATMDRESTLPRRVRNILEEVGNIPAIPGLSRYMNVGLERGLLYHLVVQSLSQLKKNYGDDGQEAIFSACGNKYYIMGDGKSDAEEFSDLLGKTTIISASRHGSPESLDKSFGESEKERKLMFAEELRLLMPGEWIVVRTKHRTDLKGNRVKPRPLMASIEYGTEMLFAYEYLNSRFYSHETLDEVADELTFDNRKSNLFDISTILESDFNNLNIKKEEESTESTANSNTKEFKNKNVPDKNTNITRKNLEDRIQGIDTSTPIELTDSQMKLFEGMLRKNLGSQLVSYLLEIKTTEELKNTLLDYDQEALFKSLNKAFKLEREE